jgi:hypothetical protein
MIEAAVEIAQGGDFSGGSAGGEAHERRQQNQRLPGLIPQQIVAAVAVLGEQVLFKQSKPVKIQERAGRVVKGLPVNGGDGIDCVVALKHQVSVP